MNIQHPAPMIFDYEEPASDESEFWPTPLTRTASILLDDEPTMIPFPRTASTHRGESDNFMADIIANDNQRLKSVPDYDKGVQGFNSWAILDINPGYAFGFDYANGDRDKRDRLEETLSGLEKVLQNVVRATVCKRTDDGIRIKAHRLEPDGKQTHIMLQVSKIVKGQDELSRLVVRAVKRGGDMFAFRDMFDKIKTAVESDADYD